MITQKDVVMFGGGGGGGEGSVCKFILSILFCNNNMFKKFE